MTEICQCGHAKGNHQRKRPDGSMSSEKWCRGDNAWDCKCKKFKPKKGMEILMTPRAKEKFDEMFPDGIEQKGCGKWYEIEDEINMIKQELKCGTDELCPECSNLSEKDIDSGVALPSHINKVYAPGSNPGSDTQIPQDSPVSNERRIASLKTPGDTFNLSDEIWDEGEYGEHIEVKDVKTFIKKDTHLIVDFVEGKINFYELLEKRKKLAGKKLK